MTKTLRAAIIAFTALTAGITASAQHAFLDQPLIEALDETPSNELISIGIILEDVVDLAALKTDFNERKLPAKERAPLVEQALKEKAGATQPAVLDFIQSSNLEYADIQTFWISNSIALKADPQLVEALSNRQDIAYMYLNRKAFGYMPKVLKGTGEEKSVGGIEPGLEAIGAPEMWAMGYTGHGRIAMTYDTGVWDDHPSHDRRFLANRMPLQSTWYAYDRPLPGDKSSSHGTHVTGTMLGLDTATNDTIGMAPRAYYIATDPVVSDLADVKPLTDFMFGYEWSINPDGDPETTDDIPDVINNSWGFGPDLDEAPCPEFVVPVFSAVEAAGIANVFSAGNEGSGEMTMSVPHNINTGLVNSFTVGATSSIGNYAIADFSSRGPSQCGGEGSLLIKPEVSAPGVNVRSSIENGEYDFFSGTSMAAPHVSGAVLLLREAFPDVTGEEILLAIYNSAIDLGEPGEDNTYGMGFVNVKAAYDLLDVNHDPTPPAVLNTDIELVRVVNSGGDIRCFSETGAITPIIEVRNNGSEVVEGFNLFYSIVGETEEIPVEVLVTLPPGVSVEIPLQEINYELSGIKELYVRAELLADEYDTFNNQIIDRWIELPKFDWEVEGSFQENFSDGIDPNFWTVRNEDADITWDTVSALQIDETTGLAAYVNHHNYTTVTNQEDYLISPLILNRPSEVNSMAFDYFYRKRNSSGGQRDTLVLTIHRGCGEESISQEIFRRGGEELWTNDDSDADAFPETPADWRTLYVNLDFDNDIPFYFSLQTINRRGNNLLVDNFRMDVNLSSADVTSNLASHIYPNPTSDSFRIEWNETGKGDVSIYDLSGRLINVQRSLESGTIVENLNLQKGAYIVEVAVGKNKSSQKLIVN